MKVLIFNSPELAVARVAELITDQICKKPDSALGLATGGTVELAWPQAAPLSRFIRCWSRLIERMALASEQCAALTSTNMSGYLPTTRCPTALTCRDVCSITSIFSRQTPISYWVMQAIRIAKPRDSRPGLFQYRVLIYSFLVSVRTVT